MTNSTLIAYLGFMDASRRAAHGVAHGGGQQGEPQTTVARGTANGSGNQSNIREHLSHHEQLSLDALIIFVYFTFRVMESALAVLGNFLTIGVVVRVREMRTNTNLLIVSLALGDLLSGLDTPFYIMAEVLQGSRSGHMCCLLAEFIDLLGGFGNTFSIACIALDRFLAVSYPVWYNRSYNLAKVVRLLIAMWVYIVVFLSGIFLFGLEDYKYPLCFFKSNLAFWAHDGVIYGHVAVLASITCYLYVKVWCNLRRRHCLMNARPCPRARRRHQRGKRLLGFVLVAYFSLATPITLASFSGLLAAQMAPWQHALFRLCWAVWYMNSFVNPILYVWFNRCFRRAIRQQFCVKETPETPFGAKMRPDAILPGRHANIMCPSDSHSSMPNSEIVQRESSV